MELGDGLVWVAKIKAMIRMTLFSGLYHFKDRCHTIHGSGIPGQVRWGWQPGLGRNQAFTLGQRGFVVSETM